MHRIRLFRNGDHLRTVFFVTDSNAGVPPDSRVNLTRSVPAGHRADHDFAVRWLNESEGALQEGLRPRGGDILYSGDLFYGWIGERWKRLAPIPSLTALYSKAVAAEGGA